MKDAIKYLNQECFESKKDRVYKSFLKALYYAVDQKILLDQGVIDELIIILERSLDRDDEVMSLIVKALALCSKNKETSLVALISAIEWRPNDGEYYDPKSWREDLNTSIKYILSYQQVLDALKTENCSLAEAIEVFFSNPVNYIQPLLDNEAEMAVLSKNVAKLLLLIVELSFGRIHQKLGNPADLKELESLCKVTFLPRDILENLGIVITPLYDSYQLIYNPN